MMQIDLAKAFDRVSHEILLDILKHVNVGSVILEGVKMVYNECTTRIVINRTLTESIPVRSSVRQGCPLSPLLFAIYLEPFCLSVINDQSVRGFQLHTNEVKILAYADDIAVFCTDSVSVLKVEENVTKYCTQTGSAINWEKSAGFWHGCWQSPPEYFANMRWTTMPTAYLGAPLECYKESAEYWAGETKNMNEKVQAWQGRDFSMFARAYVCNVFLVAKVWYVLQVLFMSRVSVQKIHRVFATFIWGSSWERTSRTNLFRSVRCGGLGLAHLFIRQLVARFIFLRDQSDPFLRTVIQVRLQSHLPEFIVSSTQCMRWAVTGYRREVISSYRFLTVRFSREYLSTITRKKLYRDLVDTLLPVPLYPSNYIGKEGQDVL